MARILNTGFASAIDVVNHISCQISCHSSRMVCSRDAEHEYFSWCLPCFIPSMWYCFRTQTMQLLTHSGLSQNQRSRTSVVWWLPSGFPQWLSRKESTYKAGDAGDLASVPESGGSPGGGDDNPLRYRIPWAGEPGGLQYLGSPRVRNNWSDWGRGSKGDVETHAACCSNKKKHFKTVVEIVPGFT